MIQNDLRLVIDRQRTRNRVLIVTKHNVLDRGSGLMRVQNLFLLNLFFDRQKRFVCYQVWLQRLRGYLLVQKLVSVQFAIYVALRCGYWLQLIIRCGFWDSVQRELIWEYRRIVQHEGPALGGLRILFVYFKPGHPLSGLSYQHFQLFVTLVVHHLYGWFVQVPLWVTLITFIRLHISW